MTDNQLEFLSDHIIKHFNFSDRLKELTDSAKTLSPTSQSPKNPPNLRIRGLVMRNSYNDKKYNHDDEDELDRQSEEKEQDED